MKLLVINDEQAVLSAIYQQLRNIHLDFEQIDIAESAKQARRMAAVTYYDLFLCDIVMPEEDGISFARWALSQFKDSKFIFLTAHADYEYMKAAISMQSFDYLLQPVERHELYLAIERAQTQIRIERKNRNSIETGTFYKEHRQDFLDQGTQDYIEGRNEDEGYLLQSMQQCGMDMEKDYNVLPVYVQVLNEKEEKKMETDLRRSIYYNIMNEIMEPLDVVNLILPGKNKSDYLDLLFMEAGREPERADVVDKLETLRMLFEKLTYRKIAVYAGCSAKKENIVSACDGVKKLIRNNVKNESKIFQPQDSLEATAEYTFKLQIPSWKQLLEQKNFNKFCSSVENFLQNYGMHRSISADCMIRLHQEITELILFYMVNHSIETGCVFDDNIPYLKYMDSWKNVNEFMSDLRAIAGKFADLSDEKQTDPFEEAERYIIMNPERDLSVTEVADYVGMNAEYLTRIFSKRTGMGLKKYIMSKKMEAAKLLLKTTDMSVTMIADQVGYQNYSNFTYSFRQAAGMSPLEYRKKCENQKI